MTAAYATLENEGVYRATYLHHHDHRHGRQYRRYAETGRKTDLSVIRAHEMTNILEGVLTRGTAHGNAIPGMPCAGKTGTTNDNLDGWFVGYTGYYTTGVWVGFDSPRSAKALSGASYPLAIWNTYMTELHQGLTSKALND